MATNHIRDFMKDVLRHTHGLGIFEMVKITGDMTNTQVQTMDANKTVIVKGKTHKPEADLVDATVGLSRMAVLDGMLKYEGFGTDGATVQVQTQSRNGVDVPVEIHFCDESGTNANYRFMLKDVIDQQLQDIKFKGAEDDVTIVPTAKNLKDMTFFSGVLGTLEDSFSPRTEDGKLYFYIGDAGSDRTKILISEAPGGEITNELTWNLSTVLKILRLGDNANITLGINNKGLIKIVVDSGIAEYTYLLPAGK